MALLIASYDYQDTGLRRLTAPAHDAEALAEVLQDPDIAGFEVTTLVNEPHHRVGEAIGDFYRDRRRDDLTLLYFTGHGLKDDDGRLYLAMANTRPDSLLFTALSAEQIDQAMEGCVSRQKVLILDCCYSGAFPAGRLAKADTAVHALERFQGHGRTVLTASDATQYSFEGNQLHGQAAQSVFTRYLVVCRCLVLVCLVGRLVPQIPSPLPDRAVVMGSQKKWPVRLTARDREELVRVTTTGVRGASMIMRARVLLALDTSVGEVDSKEMIATRLGVSGETLRLVAKRFTETGGDVHATIARKRRDLPPVPSPVTGEVEARLIAMACSQPPQGYARWSLRLLEKHVALVEDIPDLDHSTIGRILKKRNCVLT
ncbi:caspase family protein [Streptomyces sp. V4I8]|uniref:caspase, EACC1-associated type n=2 Tax=Streptomyces sp. V4I8 TaxID=3156469 RepID=UPI00351591B4